MNLSKSILVFAAFFLLIGLLPAWAQRESGKVDLKAVSVSDKAGSAFMTQLKALKVGPSAKQAIESLKLGDIKGFNIGMPPGRSTQVIHIIFAEFRSDIKMADRSNLDGFKAASELSAAFKARGMNPKKGMAFQFNTRTLKIEPFSGVPGTGKN